MTILTHYLNHSVIDIMDVLAVVYAGLVLIFNALPAATVLLSFAWICLRIYETETIQCWLHGKKCSK